MDEELEKLVKYVRRRKMSEEELKAQRISFVMGNANIERDKYLRGTVSRSIPKDGKGID